jgi:DNA-binding transcriptional LysR family regulator
VWRVPVRGPVTTNHAELMRASAFAGVGLISTIEERIADDLKHRRLRVVLVAHAAEVPGLFLYFPSRSQRSPALKAFIAVARAQIRR